VIGTVFMKHIPVTQTFKAPSAWFPRKTII